MPEGCIYKYAKCIITEQNIPLSDASPPLLRIYLVVVSVKLALLSGFTIELHVSKELRVLLGKKKICKNSISLPDAE